MNLNNFNFNLMSNVWATMPYVQLSHKMFVICINNRQNQIFSEMSLCDVMELPLFLCGAILLWRLRFAKVNMNKVKKKLRYHINSSCKLFLSICIHFHYTVVPVFSGHPSFPAKVSLHCRCPLIRGVQIYNKTWREFWQTCQHYVHVQIHYRVLLYIHLVPRL